MGTRCIPLRVVSSRSVTEYMHVMDGVTSELYLRRTAAASNTLFTEGLTAYAASGHSTCRATHI